MVGRAFDVSLRDEVHHCECFKCYACQLRSASDHIRAPVYFNGGRAYHPRFCRCVGCLNCLPRPLVYNINHGQICVCPVCTQRRLIDFQYVEDTAGYPMGVVHDNSWARLHTNLEDLRAAREAMSRLAARPDSTFDDVINSFESMSDTMLDDLVRSFGGAIAVDELEFAPFAAPSGPDEPDELALIDPPPPYNEVQD